MPDPAERRRDPLLVLRVMALALMLVVLTRTQADPDLWGHVLFGRDIVTQRAVPAFDTYSFTSDLPWINHEWLSESVMYGSYALLGPRGLGVLKLALVLGTIGIVLWTLRRDRMPPALHDALVFLTIAGVAPLATHMRPEMFSLLLFAMLLALLREAERGKGWPLAVVPLLMLLWVNLHGGWLVGMGTLGVWAATEAAAGQVGWRGRLRLAATILIALGATLVNPYGAHIWTFLRETVGLQRTDISEWLPVYHLGPGMIVLWLLIASVAVASAVLSSKRPRLSAAAIVAMLGFASFRVGRLIGFFAVGNALLLSPQIASAWQRRKRATSESDRPTPRLASGIVLVVATVVIAASIVRMYGNLECIQMEDDWSPEPAATDFIDTNRLQGRMLTWFNWGEYAIWHFSPRILVSMDGRRETVYSEAVRTKHLGFFFNATANRAYATELKADYIWLPKQLPIAPSLVQQGWTRIFVGTRSVIFTRHDAGSRDQSASGDVMRATTGCFPGP